MASEVESQEDRDHLAAKPSKAREEELRYQLRVAERSRDTRAAELVVAKTELGAADALWKGLDPEAKALAGCVVALQPLKSAGLGRTDSLRRVLVALADRFGVELAPKAEKDSPFANECGPIMAGPFPAASSWSVALELEELARRVRAGH